MTIIFVLLLLVSCSSDSENNNSTSKGEVELVTGINIRSSEYSEVTRLGNPNVFTKNQFVVFPNPLARPYLSVKSSVNISDAWVISANAEKTQQQADFSSILNSDYYNESEIELNAKMEFIDVNSTNLILNLENLSSGYYKVFVKINGNLYWDNIFLQGNDLDVDDLINYWD
ncbi:hypothetical protein KO493_12250 [Tamlana agarivorans]|uniref:Uncharacterized protein n=1 Tax=Pseudotamlana agarivorans TaxID=481183 RepID=A0ACC5UAV3_9FLAO|nr:hypothetical protein [Tamlana agarivorans]MBU2951468.1 hypothetical protein [Tamlana agarivorans]